MSERDFAMALAMLAEAFGEKGLTPVRIEAYHKGLKDVPLPLLNAAVRKGIETRSWFPKVAELRHDAEVCRRELMDRHTFEACQLCEASGWRQVEVDGVARVTRCTCWKDWQQRLTELGVTSQALALPAAREFSRIGEDV